MNNNIAFIGAGKMVSAIVKSLIRSHSFQPGEISCCSANDGTSEALSLETGIIRCENVGELIGQNPNLLVLGCKPQQLNELPPEIAESAQGIIILSIMAGITLDRLKNAFPVARNIVRSMPNTPGQIGSGITGFLFETKPTDEDYSTVQNVLSSLGQVKEVEKEIDIDRVTAISGSGPAYLFEFTCALEEAGKEIGLAPELAKELAFHTIVGAAKLMENSSFQPEELRNQVTSPNGTTQAALESFSKDQLRDIVTRAAHAARDRSIELSNA
ncbi:MAG: pyrroline-5-carboxylate reductase [Opitutae bacterium]